MKYYSFGLQIGNKIHIDKYRPFYYKSIYDMICAINLIGRSVHLYTFQVCHIEDGLLIIDRNFTYEELKSLKKVLLLK